MSRPFVSIAGAFAALLVWSCSLDVFAAAAAPLLLRDPALSDRQIAFSYAGDIWAANRNGTDLHRLTMDSHAMKPVFSPDGSRIAYVADRDGERAVYVIAASGGEPKRLTYHPADLGIDTIPDVVGWTPDGQRVLFNSRRAAFVRSANQSFISQLFTVPADGGFVAQVPVARAVQAAFSADGTRIAYVPNVQRQLDWKRYRGGETTPIWIVNLADSSVTARIPRDNSNDFNPMWVGDTIYFLSDRSGPVTLFAYDVSSGQVRQILANDGLDIKSASAAADAIIYEQFGSLHLLDLKSGKPRPLNIRPQADFPQLRPAFKKVEPSQIKVAGLSPDGTRAVFGVRGEIVMIPVGEGEARNVTHTTSAVERDPAWSPDGRSIAYFCDESGEYALHIRDTVGRDDVRKINLGDPPAFYYSPTWSTDSRKIAYTDQRLNYWYVDVATNKPVHVDTDLFTDPAHERQMAWSADSLWIAYTRQLPNHLHAVFVYSLEDARSYQLTDGRSDALRVTFDKTGEYIYFTASTDTALATGWMDETSLQRPVTRSIYAIALQAASKSHRTSSIDLEGIERRIAPLPIPARNYYDLIASKPGVLFLVAGPQLDPLQSYSTGVSGTATTVYRFDRKTQMTEQVVDGVMAFHPFLRYEPSFRVSFNGDVMLYASQGQWFVRTVSPGPGARLNLEKVRIYSDPRAEWEHMYAQVWRDERDFFYDPGLHGIDLEVMKKRYAPFLRNISTRQDLNYLFSEMLGNLTVSHMSASGGDPPANKGAGIGLLGADYTAEGGRYRFARIYGGDIWDPDNHAPLAQPGGEVHVGEYLLAVNGREVRSTVDVYGFFEQTAGRSTELTVGREPDGTDAREVTVMPLADESALRNFDWVEKNRRKVDEMSGGRVAYVYLPDTSARGYKTFNREYFGQVGKVAAIIDDRYNSGGIGSDYMIDYLRRPLMNYWHMRYGRDITAPQEAIFGPKVMIINEMAGSGGEALPWAFRQADIGPLIGKRTWGGLVGAYTIPDDLLDGGTIWTPNLAFYSPSGTWDIENHGVPPDIEVDDDPKAEREGHDLQLDKAIDVVLELLQIKPAPKSVQIPPFPNYHPQ
jgi:tricorn protease